MKVKNYLIFLTLLLNCKDPVEEGCKNTCHLFQNCLEQHFKKSETKMDFLFIPYKEIRVHCMSACTRNQDTILSCYEETGGSCKEFGNCILQTGLAE